MFAKNPFISTRASKVLGVLGVKVALPITCSAMDLSAAEAEVLIMEPQKSKDLFLTTPKSSFLLLVAN